MTGRSQSHDSQKLLEKLRQLLSDFESELQQNDLRQKVLALVPVVHTLQNLGKSFIPKDLANSGRDRILHYFQKYPHQVISGEELLIVSGISDWPRRVRELRQDFGWSILSGVTVREMLAQEENTSILGEQNLATMKPKEYILTNTEQDRDAAHRWRVANSIRRKKASVQDKILEFLRANVGRVVSGEELRYVAKGRTEWARRVRELRTEKGWSVATRQSGRPELKIGEYVLEADRQTPAHDRKISDSIRIKVLEHDQFQCTNCGWSRDKRRRDDPRTLLELHHIKPHVKGGENTSENLVTLCNVCHDDVHRQLNLKE